ncbi:hypothetical protein C7S14_7955 [Burkholderia cepacia]|nr:hypothetical protein C7S14_7955 [Burkholderia cepacia]
MLRGFAGDRLSARNSLAHGPLVEGSCASPSGLGSTKIGARR